MILDSDMFLPSSYEVDPTYQRKFSIVWASIAAFFVLAALPGFVLTIRAGRVRDALFGIREDFKSYEPLPGRRKEAMHSKPSRFGRLLGSLSFVKAFTIWTMPLIGLDIGQRTLFSLLTLTSYSNIYLVTLVIAYYVTIILCIVLNAELIDNPNRAGFLAIAQLPPVFLLATKNSPLAILTTRGYEKLNYLHRWCSRGVLLAAAIHGSLWIRNHLEYGLQILGPQKETSGVAAFALLCVLAVSSVRPVRIHAYQVFRLVQ